MAALVPHNTTWILGYVKIALFSVWNGKGTSYPPCEDKVYDV